MTAPERLLPRTVTLSDGSVWVYAPRWDDKDGLDAQAWHEPGNPNNRYAVPHTIRPTSRVRIGLTAADHRAIADVLEGRAPSATPRRDIVTAHVGAPVVRPNLLYTSEVVQSMLGKLRHPAPSPEGGTPPKCACGHDKIRHVIAQERGDESGCSVGGCGCESFQSPEPEGRYLDGLVTGRVARKDSANREHWADIANHSVSPEGGTPTAADAVRRDWRFAYLACNDDNHTETWATDTETCLARTEASLTMKGTRGAAGVYLDNDSLLAIRHVLEIAKRRHPPEPEGGTPDADTWEVYDTRRADGHGSVLRPMKSDAEQIARHNPTYAIRPLYRHPPERPAPTQQSLANAIQAFIDEYAEFPDAETLADMVLRFIAESSPARPAAHTEGPLTVGVCADEEGPTYIRTQEFFQEQLQHGTGPVWCVWKGVDGMQKIICITGNGPTSEANARFIASMFARPAAGEVTDEQVEAAQCADPCERCDGILTTANPNCRECMRSILTAALAARHPTRGTNND